MYSSSLAFNALTASQSIRPGQKQLNEGGGLSSNFKSDQRIVSDITSVASSVLKKVSAPKVLAASSKIPTDSNKTTMRIKNQNCISTNKTERENLPSISHGKPLPSESTTWELKTRAANILAGKGQQGPVKIPIQNKSSRRRMELQGPIDWASKGLRHKYRGEIERETAWMSWKVASLYAAQLFDSDEEAVSVAHIARHPLFSKYETRLSVEWIESVARTLARVRMKRFVMDAHEVWLTNLQHLKENRYEEESARDDSEQVPNSATSSTAQEVLESETENNLKSTVNIAADSCSQGLEGRRDSEAILAMCSQIQSVSLQRACQRAHRTDSNIAYLRARSKTEGCDSVNSLSSGDAAALAPDIPLLKSISKPAQLSVIPDLVTPVSCPALEIWEAVTGPSACLAARGAPAPNSVHGMPSASAEGGEASQSSSQRPQSVSEVTAIGAEVVPLDQQKQQKPHGEGGVSLQHDGAAPCGSAAPLLPDTTHLSVPVLALANADLNGTIHNCDEISNTTGAVAVAVGLTIDNLSELISTESLDSQVRADDSSRDSFASLSLLASGRLPGITPHQPQPQTEQGEDLSSYSGAGCEVVPGACDISIGGLWPLSPSNGTLGVALSSESSAAMRSLRRSGGDFTRAAALFQRVRNVDRERGQCVCMQLKVALLLALDAPEVFVSAPYIAEEGGVALLAGSGPEKWPLESIQDPHPVSTISHPLQLLSAPLANALQERLALPATIFDSCPSSLGQRDSNMAAFSQSLGLDGQGRGAKGFRCRVSVSLLDADPTLLTVVFGVSRSAALPNCTGVNTRNIWHATQPITDKINRVRDAGDLIYVAAIHRSSGANHPDVFTVHMSSGEFLRLSSSLLEIAEAEHDATHLKRERFARQMALEGKIEASEMILKARRKELELSIRRDMQLALEKKIRKVSKSERGWRRRFDLSSLVETQGGWERRLDGSSSGQFKGMMFFRRIGEKGVSTRASRALKQQQRALGVVEEEEAEEGLGDQREKEDEKFASTCQWEVPGSWTGDPLSRPQTHSSEALNGSFGADTEGDALLAGTPHWAVNEDGTVAASTGSTLNTSWSGCDVGAFQMPDEDWMPGNEEGDRQGGQGQGYSAPSRLLVTPGAALRGDRRWNTVVPSSADSRVAEGGRGADRSTDLKAIAEGLVSSDALMRLLAKRLGLPEPPLDAGSPPAGPRPHYGSRGHGHGNGNGDSMAAEDDSDEDDWGGLDGLNGDDLWSSDERQDDGEGAVAEEEMEQILRDQHEAPSDVIAKHTRKAFDRAGSIARQARSTPAIVTYLDLQAAVGRPQQGWLGGTAEGVREGEGHSHGHVRGMGWRKLPRPEVSSSFYSKCTSAHTLGSSSGPSDSHTTVFSSALSGPSPPPPTNANTPTYMSPIAPTDACQYEHQDFTGAYESIFVRDARADIERSMGVLDRNVRREEQFSQSIPTEDLLLIQARDLENTSVDLAIAQQYREDMGNAAAMVPRPADRGPPLTAPQQQAEAETVALLAAKNSNLEAMEDALEADISTETVDPGGNTLLILAAQGGSKRMCKFLLRRGAKMNAQNVAGNTCLHFTVLYGFTELTQYLISKGAQDSLLNREGLTCYEGLSRSKAMYKEFD